MLIDFDVKEKIKELKRRNQKTPRGYFDVGVAYWLINPDEKEYAADYLCRKFLRRECEGAKKDIEALYKFAEKN